MTSRRRFRNGVRTPYHWDGVPTPPEQASACFHPNNEKRKYLFFFFFFPKKRRLLFDEDKARSAGRMTSVRDAPSPWSRVGDHAGRPAWCKPLRISCIVSPPCLVLSALHHLGLLARACLSPLHTPSARRQLRGQADGQRLPSAIVVATLFVAEGVLGQLVRQACPRPERQR
jgi:hypothetical protein